MNEEDRTAFHEAGHSRIAYSINAASVGDVRIYQENGTWRGSAAIELEGMSATQRTAIALAGLLAEARAAAIEDTGDHTRRLAPIEQLSVELGRVIGVALQNRLEVVDAHIHCTTTPIGSAPVPARLTLEDIEFIPDAIAGDDNQIGHAATIARNIINHGIEWASVIAIAEALKEHAPDALPDFLDVIAPH